MNKHILALHTFAACVNEFANDQRLYFDLVYSKIGQDLNDWPLLDYATEAAIQKTEALIVQYLG